MPVLKATKLLCWSNAGPCDDPGEYVGYHPFKSVTMMRSCYRAKALGGLCNRAPACRKALDSVHTDGRTCRIDLQFFILKRGQLSEEEACDRVAAEYPATCGPCAATASAREARSVRAGPGDEEFGGQVVLLRSTAGLMLSRATHAAVVVMQHQLGATLRLLIDMTICSGLACSVPWLAQRVGVGPDEAWGYTACDVTARWPSVRWPVFDIDKPTLMRQEGNYGQCWLVKAASDIERAARDTAWPHAELDPRRGLQNRAGHCAANSGERAAGLVPYLVHEPSIILWWRAHESRLKGPVWVVEQDALFGASLPYFLRVYERLPADLVSVFCRHPDGKGSCDDAAGGDRTGHRDSRKHFWRHFRSRGLEHFANASLGLVHHWEHVVRFSPRLLAALEQALDRGVVQHGEMFASTYCLAHPSWCTTRDLRETLSFSKAIGPDKLASRQRMPHHARWHHADARSICSSLLRWQHRRDDANATDLRRRLKRDACNPSREAAGVRSNWRASATPDGVAWAASELSSLRELTEPWDCEMCCRAAWSRSWCCPSSAPIFVGRDEL